MRVEKDFKEFIALLHKNSVRYLIVGGFAFAFHAEPRFTKDIDIFLDTAPENVAGVMKSLAEFGFGASGLKPDDFSEPNQIIQLGVPPVRIDLLTSISGLEFGTAWENRVMGNYGDVPAIFISKADLIANKKATGRKQDLSDIDRLYKI